MGVLTREIRGREGGGRLKIGGRTFRDLKNPKRLQWWTRVDVVNNGLGRR